MSVDWFRVATSLVDDPKLDILEARLGPGSCKVLLRVWTWAARLRRDGVFRPGEVDIAARCPASTAMIEAGFLEDDGCTLHDWEHHNGKAIRRMLKDREDAAERMRRARSSSPKPPSPTTTSTPTATATATGAAERSGERSAEPTPNRYPSFKVWARDVWNPFASLHALPVVKVEAPQTGREGKWASRCRTPGWFESLPDVLGKIPSSDFLMGKIEPTNGHVRMIANVDWLLGQDAVAKTLEGKYDNRNGSFVPHPPPKPVSVDDLPVDANGCPIVEWNSH